MALRVPAESIDDYEANPEFTVVRDAALFNYVGLLNTQNPPLDNPLVRQAIAYATPYADIIEVAVQGEGTQSRAAVPIGVFPYDESVPVYETDIEKARELMAAAGVDGFDVELTPTPPRTPSSKPSRRCSRTPTGRSASTSR